MVVLVGEIKTLMEVIEGGESDANQQTVLQLKTVAGREIAQLREPAERVLGVFLGMLSFVFCKVVTTVRVGLISMFVVRVPHVGQGRSESSFELVVFSAGEEVQFQGESDPFLAIITLFYLIVASVPHARSIAPMGIRRHTVVK